MLVKSENLSKIDKSSFAHNRSRATKGLAITKPTTPALQETVYVPHLFNNTMSTKNLLMLTKSSTLQSSTINPK